MWGCVFKVLGRSAEEQSIVLVFSLSWQVFLLVLGWTMDISRGCKKLGAICELSR